MGPERTGYNNLTLEVYSAFSTTPVMDMAGDLARAQGLTFDTFYPGGLFGVCRFTVVRDPRTGWLFKIGQRLVVRNGLKAVWEGMIISPGYFADAGSGGRIIEAAGFWGKGLLGARGLRKAWADTRISQDAWVPQKSLAAEDKCLISESAGTLKMVPKAEVWNAAEYVARRYTMPTGQTVKRVKWNHDFNEDARTPPSVIFHFDGGTTYTKLTNAYDGDTSTSVTVTITTAHYIYVGMHAGDTDKVPAGATGRLVVTMGSTKNAVASVLSCAYWNGAWTALTITDGTSTGGKTLAQDGTITFTRPGDWAATALGDANSTSKMWLRFAVSVNLTANINIAEIEFGMRQDWYIVLYNVDTAAEEATTKVSGNSVSSKDITLGTPSQAVEIRMVAGTQQTPWSNGKVHAEFSGVVVYADANTINPTEIVKDWIASISNLNSDTSQVASNTLGVEPWITGDSSLDFETAADNLARLAALGDASYNPWACYVLESEFTASPNGLPVLAYQQQPALSDYDYQVQLDTPTLNSIGIGETDLANYLWVKYIDTNGIAQWQMPTDDSGLTDSTSISTFAQFEVALDVGRVSSAAALARAKQYLAANKDRHFYMTAPIPVQGYLLDKNGQPVPAANVRAGKRLRVVNFLTDLVGTSGAGLTFLITGTRYDDASETVTIECGVPDSLAVLMAQAARAR